MIKSEQPIMVGCLLLIYKKIENRFTRIPLYKRGSRALPYLWESLLQGGV